MSKTIYKNVKFEFYEVCLEYDLDSLRNELSEIAKELGKSKKAKVRKLRDTAKLKRDQIKIEELITKSGECSVPYDLIKLINLVKSGKVDESQLIFNKLIELDINSILPNTEEADNEIFFQLSNNREVDIPSKKTIGQERIDIKLNDDEYIGEFMSVLFNKNTATAMIQLNRYALSIRQVELYFNKIRTELFKKRNKEHDNKIIRLVPMMDEKMLDKMLDSENFSKIHIRASDVALRSLSSDGDSGMFELNTILNSFKGVNIDVTVSVDTRNKKNNPLDATEIKKVYEEFKDMKDNLKPNIETTFKEDENSRNEVANWLIPKMNELISFKFEPRQTLGYGLVYEKMKEAFNKKIGRISLYHANKFDLCEVNDEENHI